MHQARRLRQRLDPISRERLASLIRQYYQVLLNREASPAEVEAWSDRVQKGLSFFDLWDRIYQSEEADRASTRLQEEADRERARLQSGSDGEFIGFLYETLLARGASARDISCWRGQLGEGWFARRDLLQTIFAVGWQKRDAVPAPSRIGIMGRAIDFDIEDWHRRVAQSKAAPRDSYARFALGPRATPKVSIVTTIYRASSQIRAFMDNMTSQTVFDQCELIIIDAESPDQEAAIIDEYASRFKQIRYHRLPYTCTIYAAWNLAISLSKGDYITNANVDDLRRQDSFELQAATLDNLPFVDVVYQDFLYCWEPNLSFDAIRQVNLRSYLPLVTPHTLAQFNSPHNAPMWRRSVHQDVGHFDDCLRSAADWEFWIRCLIKGKVFFKLNDPHVAYFVNPKGMSTRASGPAHEEGLRVSRRLMRRLMPTGAMEDEDVFASRLKMEGAVRDPSGRSRYRHIQSMLRDLAESKEGRYG